MGGNQLLNVELRDLTNKSDLISLDTIDFSGNNLTTLEPWPLIRGRVHGNFSRCTIDLHDSNIAKFTNRIDLELNK